MEVWDFLGSQKDFICSYNGPLGAHRRAPIGQKWVSNTYSVRIGQLDHYVVSVTKSDALQEIQRGKKCIIGVK